MVCADMDPSFWLHWVGHVHRMVGRPRDSERREEEDEVKEQYSWLAGIKMFLEIIC